MNPQSADYPCSLPGIRLLTERLVFGRVCAFAISAHIDSNVCGQIVYSLPDSCELCFTIADPERRDEAFEFVRRRTELFFSMQGGHGWTTNWSVTKPEKIVADLMGSPLVKHVFPDIEAFRVSEIPSHQRTWHLAAAGL